MIYQEEAQNYSQLQILTPTSLNKCQATLSTHTQGRRRYRINQSGNQKPGSQNLLLPSCRTDFSHRAPQKFQSNRIQLYYSNKVSFLVSPVLYRTSSVMPPLACRRASTLSHGDIAKSCISSTGPISVDVPHVAVVAQSACVPAVTTCPPVIWPQRDCSCKQWGRGDNG